MTPFLEAAATTTQRGAAAAPLDEKDPARLLSAARSLLAQWSERFAGQVTHGSLPDATITTIRRLDTALGIKGA